MKLYCINLDRRPDRRAYIEEACARHGLGVERIAAVDGDDPEVAAAAAALPPMARGKHISPGAYGCLQSHRIAWRRLIESGESHAIVIEDDIVLADGIADLAAGTDWIPEDADIVRVETSGHRVHVGTRGLRLPGGRELRRLGSLHYGTGAYVISAAAAARLRDEVLTGEPIDVVLFDPASPASARSVIYQMWPAPAIQGKRAALLGHAAPEPGWAHTSIEVRFDGQTAQASERPLQRLVRRASGEVASRRRGMRYLVVPHG